MAQPIKSLFGKQFTRLRVIAREANVEGRVRWRVKCECGTIKVVASRNLLNGTTKSCGCLRLQHLRERNEKRNEYSFLDVKLEDLP
jgi:hypothetical protein